MAHATTTTQILDDYLAVWNEADYEWIPEVVSESFVLHTPTVGEIHGWDGLEAVLRELHETFSEFSISLTDRLVDDQLAMADGFLTGTHVGEFRGIPPSGNRMELQFMVKYRVADGRIAEHWIVYNVAELVEQLSPETD